MAIKLSNLDKISNQYKQKDFIFNDLHLDIKNDGFYSTVFHRKTNGNDISMDYDESAIRNSLRNLFNTKPGQRFLFPLYGLDLNVYLFEAISEGNGRIIGERIVKCVADFEPRVTVEECLVETNPDENQYDITLMVRVPIFNTTASINTVLDIKSQSFIFLETSRNR